MLLTLAFSRTRVAKRLAMGKQHAVILFNYKHVSVFRTELLVLKAAERLERFVFAVCRVHSHCSEAVFERDSDHGVTGLLCPLHLSGDIGLDLEGADQHIVLDRKSVV